MTLHKRGKQTTAILFLDKEGGFGGSSRSLYFLVKNLNRGRFESYVALRESGPAEDRYQALGIRTFTLRNVPLYKPSPRKNLFVLAQFLLRLPFFLNSCRLLSRFIGENGIDIVHMNHDSFFVYGFYLRRHSKAKIIVHMRTMLPTNGYAAFQAACIERIADHLIFISENELRRYRDLLGRKTRKSSIIFNTAEGPAETQVPLSGERDAFTAIYMGNLTYNKGADRLVDIAVQLKTQRMNHIVIVVCGEDRSEKAGKGGETVASKAKKAGVDSFFRFMGHQPEPERFLKKADVLIRPSRWNDPWGRDIIEAMAYGKPIITTGSYNRFVEHEINGFLHPKFEAAEIADEIGFLAGHPDVVERIREANRAKARQLFNGRANAAIVEEIYGELLRERGHEYSTSSP
jgi:glycosyltransferase involved in cell wall biosynthesis